MRRTKKTSDLKTVMMSLFSILLSSAIMCLLIFRPNIDADSCKWTVRVIAVPISMFAILNFYIAIYKICTVIERKNDEKRNSDLSDIGTDLPCSYIIDLLANNDIIEIIICKDGKRLKIGSSSENSVDSYEFYDKEYYIDEKVYSSIGGLLSALKLNEHDVIKTISIDGVKVSVSKARTQERH